MERALIEVKHISIINVFLTNMQEAMANMAMSLLKTLTDELEWCVLLWCFISCLDSHSDGTHSLQRIHWWASDAMLHFSKSVLMNSSTSWMTWEWVYFNLWMNYAFQSLNFVFYKICFCFWAFEILLSCWCFFVFDRLWSLVAII